ncbi:MAG: hypothetical protein ACOYLB_09375 [Phototrophicaceae bacterium]
MAYDIRCHSLVRTLGYRTLSSMPLASCCDGRDFPKGLASVAWHNTPLAEKLHQLKTVCQFMATEGNSVS